RCDEVHALEFILAPSLREVPDDPNRRVRLVQSCLATPPGAYGDENRCYDDDRAHPRDSDDASSTHPNLHATPFSSETKPLGSPGTVGPAGGPRGVGFGPFSPAAQPRRGVGVVQADDVTQIA